MIDTEALKTKVYTDEENARILYTKILNDNKISHIESVEELYEIPETWKWISLGNVGKWGAGATPSRKVKDYYGGDIPWLKTGDLNDGMITDIPEYITELALKETPVKLNPVGSVLIAMYGATIGKLGILEVEATTNQACCACRTYEGIYNKYLFYYLMSQRDSLRYMGSGGAQSNISKEKIVGYCFPLAPYAEQIRVVNAIETIFAELDKIEKLQLHYSVNLEILKSKIIDAGIQGKLTEQLPEDGTAEELLEQIAEEKKWLVKEKKIKATKELPEITEDEIPFEIPSNWKWVRIGDLIQIKSGDGLVKNDMTEGEIPVYGGNGVSGYHNECNVYRKTVVIGRVGVNCGSVHITEEKAWVTDNAFITSYPEKYIDQDFLAICLRFLELGKRQTATAQPVISGTKVYPVLFPLPPYAEQKRIANKIYAILSVVGELSI